MAQELTPEEQAICNILLQMLPTVARLHNYKQQHLCNTVLNKILDEFQKGVRPHLEILEELVETMNAINRVNGFRATVNALLAQPGSPVESNCSSKED